MVPLGSTGEVDGWSIRIEEVVSDEAASSLVTGWNSSNASAPDGLIYVAVKMSLKNTWTVTRILNSSSFLVSGHDGVLRGSPDLAIPKMIDGSVAPNETRQGWAVFVTDSSDIPILWYADGFQLPNWMDYSFGLNDSATVLTFTLADKGTIADGGRTPNTAASIGETVIAGDWIVSVHEVIEGQSVRDRGGAGLAALAHSDATHVKDWLAARLTIVNAGDRPALFSPSATEIADSSGEPWVHIKALTPPSPDVSVFLFPGYTYTGWAAYQRWDYDSNGAIYSNAELLRILPQPLVDSPRWISIGSQTSPATTTWTVGTTAQINDDQVNLRATASHSGKIVAELGKGERIRVTGDVVTADDVEWVPVTVLASGQSGYVSSAFLTADS